jgi:hypothetical protein
MIRGIAVLALLSLGAMAATPAQARGLSGFLTGVNGVLTAPADPVSHVLQPLEDFAEVPGYPVTGRVLGIVSGTLLAAYRTAAGLLDVAFTPLWVVPTLSPDARFEIIPIPES